MPRTPGVKARTALAREARFQRPVANARRRAVVRSRAAHHGDEFATHLQRRGMCQPERGVESLAMGRGERVDAGGSLPIAASALGRAKPGSQVRSEDDADDSPELG